MRIGRLSGFLVLIAALPRVLLAAGEPPTPAPISVEPAVLPAPPSTASVSGSVVITVPQENQVRLRAMPAVEGDALAPITFPFSKDSDGKPRDWMDVALSNGAARVAFSVAPPPEAGLYRGSIQAFRADDTLLATAEVIVQRLSSAFSVAVSGTALKDGQLEVLASAKEADIVFTVKNIADKGARTLFLTVPEPVPNQPMLVFTPNMFRLAAGQEEQVAAHITDVARGKSHLVLRIADAAQPGLYRDVLIGVERSLLGGWVLVITPVLVVLGAILSVLVRTVFPTHIAKRRNRDALGQSEGIIRRCVSASPLLKSALLAEAGRIRLMNGAVRWYAPDRAQQVELIDRLVTALAAKVDLATRIAAVRDVMATRLDMPFTTVISVEQALEQAEDLTLQNHPDSATTVVDGADASRQGALSEANLQQLRGFLSSRADYYEPLLQSNPPPDWPPVILDFARRVVAIKPQLDRAPVDDLVRAEHEALVLQGYLDDFLPSVARNPDCRVFEDLFIRLMQTDRGPVAVQPLSVALQVGLTPNAIHNALTGGGVEIVTEPDVPIYNALMQIGLRFHDPQQQGTGAVRKLIEYEWEFGDGTQSVRAERGQHYYLRPRRHWWKRSPVAPLPPFVLSCTMTVPFASINPAPTPFTVRRSIDPLVSADGHGFSVVELASFVITALISVLVAYSAQYTSAAPLESLNGWLTPFLFGFGLDQLRHVAAAR